MRFKSPKSLAEGLKLWRTEVLKIGLDKIAERGKKESEAPYADGQQFRRFESGDSFPTTERLIQDVFPAYDIKHLDNFLLGYCPPRLRGLSEVHHLQQGEEIGHEKQYGGTTRYGVSDARFLGQIPVRIDRFVIPKGGKSDTIRHSGYNYLLVTKGRVCCQLEDDNDGSKSYNLKTGDALLFPTTLWHSIAAIGDADAEFVVAVPGWAPHDLQRK